MYENRKEYYIHVFIIKDFFQARSAQDRENCILTGATYLMDGRIILVDQMLRKLKLFDQNYHWVGEKVLPARPYDICNVTESEIAVTFPREKKIQVFSGQSLFSTKFNMDGTFNFVYNILQ